MKDKGAIFTFFLVGGGGGAMGFFKMLFEDVGFQILGRDSADLASGGLWFHNWHARTEKHLVFHLVFY